VPIQVEVCEFLLCDDPRFSREFCIIAEESFSLEIESTVDIVLTKRNTEQ
jgi:hypothetical protein